MAILTGNKNGEHSPQATRHRVFYFLSHINIANLYGAPTTCYTRTWGAQHWLHFWGATSGNHERQWGAILGFPTYKWGEIWVSSWGRFLGPPFSTTLLGVKIFMEISSQEVIAKISAMTPTMHASQHKRGRLPTAKTFGSKSMKHAAHMAV